MPPEPLLVVRDLSIDLLPARNLTRDSARIAPRNLLRDVSFQLPRGVIAGLRGDSGSGKTTLALALLNLLPREPTASPARSCSMAATSSPCRKPLSKRCAAPKSPWFSRTPCWP